MLTFSRANFQRFSLSTKRAVFKTSHGKSNAVTIWEITEGLMAECCAISTVPEGFPQKYLDDYGFNTIPAFYINPRPPHLQVKK